MPYCPSCGNEVKASSNYCAHCGAEIEVSRIQYERKISVSLKNLRKDIRMRDKTDEILAPKWLLLFIVPVVFMVFIVVSAAFFSMSKDIGISGKPIYLVNQSPIPFDSLALLGFGSLALGLVADLFNMALLVKLINRRNAHFRRQKLLLKDVYNVIKELSGRRGVDISGPLASGERTLREAEMNEPERGLAKWVILSVLLGIPNLYVDYFLMKDFYRHERREDIILEEVNNALDELGIRLPSLRRIESMPNRSFAVYLILSIITAGIFGFYWMYILLKDPNEHFKHHVLFEDQLLLHTENMLTSV